jgi:hypothetical protein
MFIFVHTFLDNNKSYDNSDSSSLFMRVSVIIIENVKEYAVCFGQRNVPENNSESFFLSYGTLALDCLEHHSHQFIYTFSFFYSISLISFLEEMIFKEHENQNANKRVNSRLESETDNSHDSSKDYNGDF